MTATTTAPSINSAYAIQDSEGPRYPWLQASEYKPRNAKEEVKLCSPEQAIELLAEGALEGVQSNPVEVNFGNESGLAYELANVRWVILSRPSTWFAQNKDDGEIVRIFKGMKFGKTYKSVSRLYLACIVGDRIMVDAEGKIQIWQMKLSGLKTQWINGKDQERSIFKLNDALAKHYGIARGWVTHLVSTSISAYPRLFKGASDESWGTMFGFSEGDNAKPLSEDNQRLLFEFVTSEDFQSLASDPFGIERKTESDTSPQQSSDDSGMSVDDYDDIPF